MKRDLRAYRPFQAGTRRFPSISRELSLCDAAHLETRSTRTEPATNAEGEERAHLFRFHQSLVREVRFFPWWLLALSDLYSSSSALPDWSFTRGRLGGAGVGKRMRSSREQPGVGNAKWTHLDSLEILVSVLFSLVRSRPNLFARLESCEEAAALGGLFWSASAGGRPARVAS